jgi:hypothetical protein
MAIGVAGSYIAVGSVRQNGADLRIRWRSDPAAERYGPPGTRIGLAAHRDDGVKTT